MNCPDARENLVLLAEADTQPRLPEELDEHLRICCACAEVAAKYRGVRSLLGRFAREKRSRPAVDLWTGVRQRLDAARREA